MSTRTVNGLTIKQYQHRQRYACTVRVATLGEIDVIKKLVDNFRHELGFITRGMLWESINNQTVLVAINGYQEEVVGMIRFRKRCDGITVIYDLCVSHEHQGYGVGRLLVESLCRPIILSCPVDNDANGFYEHLGFVCVDVQQGKHRCLNRWYLADNHELF